MVFCFTYGQAASSIKLSTRNKVKRNARKDGMMYNIVEVEPELWMIYGEWLWIGEAIIPNDINVLFNHY